MLSSHAPRKKGRRAKSKNGSKSAYAAVDLGTNNCRLLVAEPHGARFRVVDSYSQIVRLGEGLNSSGELSEAAIGRTIDALQTIRQKMKSYNLKRQRCVATQACRQAKNGVEFIDRIQKETGLTFKIIPPKEEAQLSVMGAADLVDKEKRFALVVDIGGGSTELSWVDARQVREMGVKGVLHRVPMIAWASFPLGVVTLSEQFPEDGSAGWYEGMVEHCKNVLCEYAPGQNLCSAFTRQEGHLIGTSGTVTSLCAVHMDLDKYKRSVVDGAWMTRTDAMAARGRLSVLNRAQRSEIPCIGDGRSDLVLAGCAILEAVWDLWPAEQMRVADRGLREGLLLSLIHGKPPRKRRRKPAKSDVKGSSESSMSEGSPDG